MCWTGRRRNEYIAVKVRCNAFRFSDYVVVTAGVEKWQNKHFMTRLSKKWVNLFKTRLSKEWVNLFKINQRHFQPADVDTLFVWRTEIHRFSHSMLPFGQCPNVCSLTARFAYKLQSCPRQTSSSVSLAIEVCGAPDFLSTVCVKMDTIFRKW